MNDEKIQLTDSFMQVMIKMAEGNPGAATVLGMMMSESEDNIINILNLDDMGIRGSSIWICYKDHCKRDMPMLIECIKNRDKDMLHTVLAMQGVIYPR